MKMTLFSRKSTIVRLLYRLYDVEGGSIEVNGIPLSKLQLKSLRKNISIVPQVCNLLVA